MSNIIAFVSIKGGVGKSTLALETASSLANDFGKSVLLIDANFSAPNIGLYLDLTVEETLHDCLNGSSLQNAIYESHGIDVVPASLNYGGTVDIMKLKALINKYKNRYDFIILDSSPHYEELKPVIATADKIFVVTSPDHVTLTTSLKAANQAASQKTPVHGLIVNRVRSPSHEYNINEIEEVSEIPVVARIKDHKKMAQALSKNTPLNRLDNSNVVSREIRNFSSALCGHPEKDSFIKKLLLTDMIKKERVNREFLRQNFYESML